MNSRSPKFLLLSLLPAAALLAQLGGCDRRPVTAEQPGAANGTAGSPSNASPTPMAGAKTNPGNGTSNK